VFFTKKKKSRERDTRTGNRFLIIFFFFSRVPLYTFFPACPCFYLSIIFLSPSLSASFYPFLVSPPILSSSSFLKKVLSLSLTFLSYLDELATGDLLIDRSSSKIRRSLPAVASLSLHSYLRHPFPISHLGQKKKKILKSEKKKIIKILDFFLKICYDLVRAENTPNVYHFVINSKSLSLGLFFFVLVVSGLCV
jgi:hypothetical protein